VSFDVVLGVIKLLARAVRYFPASCLRLLPLMWILDSEGDFLEGIIPLTPPSFDVDLLLHREARVVAAWEEVSLRSDKTRWRYGRLF
jgi:hypothetical protein